MRTVTGPDGRRYSVADTPVRAFGYGPGPNRRNTIAAVSRDHAVADRSSFQAHPHENLYHQTPLETAPAYRKGGAMSKVVRGVKNITKGYSSVQVKVRNGTSDANIVGRAEADNIQRRPTIRGARRGLT